MRRLTILLLATLLAACATSAPTVTPPAIGASAAMAPATPAALPAASPLDYLLDSAASDFRAHPPTPLGFRNVRYGQLTDGSVQHRLCGEFRVTRPDGTPDWVTFATLKTSAYEQWLGDTTYCGDKVQWAPGDLSAELQRRFDAAR